MEQRRLIRMWGPGGEGYVIAGGFGEGVWNVVARGSLWRDFQQLSNQLENLSFRVSAFLLLSAFFCLFSFLC